MLQSTIFAIIVAIVIQGHVHLVQCFGCADPHYPIGLCTTVGKPPASPGKPVPIAKFYDVPPVIRHRSPTYSLVQQMLGMNAARRR
ncbi:hypothetical protein MJO28_005001 [Puccinia striiformis f. sp. tritici]|uniref:Uncharacterized protein n=1 Tax=Puccinia striiformis f. sp. tritici TaxID=168172 RepID=A0ACC0EJ25_9BASI|nr:hypothetical protein MJO28_005001 [Puccinia striiformis f. sp. tritici]